MPHIALPIDVPGISGPLAFRPDAAKHLLGLAGRRLAIRGMWRTADGPAAVPHARLNSSDSISGCIASYSAIMAAMHRDWMVGQSALGER